MTTGDLLLVIMVSTACLCLILFVVFAGVLALRNRKRDG